MAAGPALYIGTENGLYRGEPSPAGYRARLLGLEGLGVLRARVVADVSDPRRLYAGTTRGGVFRSADAGATWQEANAGIVYKDVWSIVQHPTTGRIYVGTSPADVFWSDDGGESWTECAALQQLPSTKGWTGPLPPHVSRMKTLALADDAPYIYGAIEEGWAVRSSDGGSTWQQIAQGMDHDGHAIAPIRGNARTVVATGGKGIYRSADAGESWAKVSENLLPYRYTPADIVQHPANPGVLVTALSTQGPGGWQRGTIGVAYARSVDAGVSWELLPSVAESTRAVPRALIADPKEPDTMFAGMTDGTVWMSRDGGASFAEVLSDLPSVHSLALAAA
ncbi:MAG TPA: sialidase family protein [Chloroflexota bacterium]|nr:sialidase family protein [Chloroflexota bacterium]